MPESGIAVLYIMCVAKGRTNVELREQFFLAEGVSQTMSGFKSRMLSAGRQSSPGSADRSTGTASSSAGYSSSTAASTHKVCCHLTLILLLHYLGKRVKVLEHHSCPHCIVWCSAAYSSSTAASTDNVWWCPLHFSTVAALSWEFRVSVSGFCPQIWNRNRAQLPPSFRLWFPRPPNFWLKFFPLFLASSFSKEKIWLKNRREVKIREEGENGKIGE